MKKVPDPDLQDLRDIINAKTLGDQVTCELVGDGSILAITDRLAGELYVSAEKSEGTEISLVSRLPVSIPAKHPNRLVLLDYLVALTSDENIVLKTPSDDPKNSHIEYGAGVTLNWIKDKTQLANRLETALSKLRRFHSLYGDDIMQRFLHL